MFSLEITVKSVESLRNILASVHWQSERNNWSAALCNIFITIEGQVFVDNINQEDYRNSGRQNYIQHDFDKLEKWYKAIKQDITKTFKLPRKENVKCRMACQADILQKKDSGLQLVANGTLANIAKPAEKR